MFEQSHTYFEQLLTMFEQSHSHFGQLPAMFEQLKNLTNDYRPGSLFLSNKIIKLNPFFHLKTS
ncbi:hypothetical protein ACLIA0_09685 [Bacillaceae bacterium W0354]